ncbi:hypothetical protein [Cryobacterium sp. TMT2-14]|uniref:hypothetical protein n=1 Tax=Cryobacterium sp. TMT2-14 TaxID=1259245 RepID=UPI00141B8B29|nr:hypothetical protein [Cryobacterium sp. TMT2-14]
MLLVAAAAVITLTSCASQTAASPVVSESVQTPETAPTPARVLTQPADVTHSCTDALGDSEQDTAYDLERVDLSVNGDEMTVRWEYSALTHYSSSDNVSYSIGFKPLSGEDGYTDLTTFIGGGSKISTTLWGGLHSLGDTRISDYTWDVGAGYAAFTYPTTHIAHLGSSFTWSAHVIYNRNGHDECGTTERMLDWSTGWLVYS